MELYTLFKNQDPTNHNLFSVAWTRLGQKVVPTRGKSSYNAQTIRFFDDGSSPYDLNKARKLSRVFDWSVDCFSLSLETRSQFSIHLNK